MTADVKADVKTKRAVFLDRDGTVIVDKHYLCEPEGVELLPGAAEGLRHMRSLGLALVLVSNQSGVGRGYFGLDAVERVHKRLVEMLEAQGVRLDGIYFCPHGPEESCSCRKPAPGLIERAARELGLCASASFVVGDKPCDVDLGLRVGATTLLVRGRQQGNEDLGCAPHFVVADLDEAALRIGETLGREEHQGAGEKSEAKRDKVK